MLSISPTFILVGFQILMCGCILGWWSVAYHFGVAVTMTLTIDLTPTLFVGGLKKLECECILGWRCVTYHIGVTVTFLTLVLTLVSRIIVSEAYLLNF